MLVAESSSSSFHHHRASYCLWQQMTRVDFISIHLIRVHVIILRVRVENSVNITNQPGYYEGECEPCLVQQEETLYALRYIPLHCRQCLSECYVAG